MRHCPLSQGKYARQGPRIAVSDHSVLPLDPKPRRHAEDDLAILAARHGLYRSARELNPARWSGNTRNWSPVGAVTLNPERDCIIKTHSAGNDSRWLQVPPQRWPNRRRHASACKPRGKTASASRSRKWHKCLIRSAYQFCSLR